MRARAAALLCLLGLEAAAAARPCAPEELRPIEEALGGAPQVTEAPDGTPLPAPERRCGPTQARTVRQALAACQVAPAQAVALMGAGRCLEQAGYRQEAAAAYRRFLELSERDRSVSPERQRERRDRVRRWLMEMGEAAPETATLVLRSNLDGVEVRHLEGVPDGAILRAGDTRLRQPPGPRRLSLTAKGFARVELPVDLVDGEETRAEVDWRRHLQPRYAFLLRSWDDFVRSGLTPTGYAERKQRPLGIGLSLLVAGVGVAVVSLCAAGTGGACDAAWKQGLGYAAGGVLVGSGLVGLLTSFARRPERRPAPTL